MIFDKKLYRSRSYHIIFVTRFDMDRNDPESFRELRHFH